MAGARRLDWWAALDGQEWHVERQQGPFPFEVAGALLGNMNSEGLPSALRGKLTGADMDTSVTYTRIRFEVLGVPVVLRAVDPVGAEEALRRWLQPAGPAPGPRRARSDTRGHEQQLSPTVGRSGLIPSTGPKPPERAHSVPRPLPSR
ncbi:hypothetical protein EV385_6694 [Krasilnikovia cinnamomea]|uniref:Uncharacterized protein n=1 Tax=Krasilnikovia cinnamomea TaxID=349313 RepID=A0A4Q7ZA05_9ACTN|nr:hypothetical protein EV385_6694 [Krasilnikovia cinnamomea]